MSRTRGSRLSNHQNSHLEFENLRYLTVLLHIYHFLSRARFSPCTVMFASRLPTLSL